MQLAADAGRLKEVLRKSGDGEARMQLHNSLAIDTVTQSYWKLLQHESQRRALADGVAVPIPQSVVTRAGYEEVYIRITKTVWSSETAWDEEKAKEDARHDWDDDIKRFTEDAR